MTRSVSATPPLATYHERRWRDATDDEVRRLESLVGRLDEGSQGAALDDLAAAMVELLRERPAPARVLDACELRPRPELRR